MNVLRRESNIILLIVVIMMPNLAMAAANEGNTEKKGIEEKNYFYDEVTDAYVFQIIKQAEKLSGNGDYDKAIALLLNEQARLDKKGMKMNIRGTFVKTPRGGVRKLQEGEVSDLPKASKDEVPSLPSPLLMTLMAVRMDDGQCPIEMIDYYQGQVAEFDSDEDRIRAASHVMSLHGFRGEKMWEFVNAVFDQAEKDQLSEYLLKQYMAGDLEQRTSEIAYDELAKPHNKTVTVTPLLQTELKKTISDKGGDIKDMSILDRPAASINVNRNKRAKTKFGRPPTVDDVKYSLAKLSTNETPANIKSYYSELNEESSDTVEVLFWDCCPQWHEFNTQNRLSKAMRSRNQKKYENSYNLYNSVLDRYKDQQAISERTQYSYFESRIEEVFMLHEDYQQCVKILDDYKDLFTKKSNFNLKANSLKGLCQIFLENIEEAEKLIREKELNSQLFAGNRIVSLLSADQRMIFDDFAWEHFEEWKQYNLERQSYYARLYFDRQEYSRSVSFYDKLHRRYKTTLPQELLDLYIGSSARAQKEGLVSALLQECKDLGETEHVIMPDIIWLLHNEQADLAVNILSEIESLLGEEEALGVRGQFYQMYAYMMLGKNKESQLAYNRLRTLYPKSLYAMKASYLLEQKDKLERALKFTQNDQIDGLITKAEKCFDDGDLEMALGVYLRIFAEYEDQQEESSRACYLLGYYYLLSGDFETANSVLEFLQKEYPETTYAAEANMLIERIKDFTAS